MVSKGESRLFDEVIELGVIHFSIFEVTSRTIIKREFLVVFVISSFNRVRIVYIVVSEAKRTFEFSNSLEALQSSFEIPSIFLGAPLELPWKNPWGPLGGSPGSRRNFS